jgi:hypothetical protein
MPWKRLVGNAGLSLLSKMSTGYWTLFDPTNGYTAIHAAVARELPLEKLHRRYFFETDILFRLNTLRAVVADLPMEARYGDERSSMNLWRVLGVFPWFHLRNTLKRIFYNYFLRDFSIATVHLLAGVALVLFGLIFGSYSWIQGRQMATFASAGTVMLAALPVILGTQLLLNFLSLDMTNVPRYPLQRRLPGSVPPPERIVEHLDEHAADHGPGLAGPHFGARGLIEVGQGHPLWRVADEVVDRSH